MDIFHCFLTFYRPNNLLINGDHNQQINQQWKWSFIKIGLHSDINQKMLLTFPSSGQKLLSCHKTQFFFISKCVSCPLGGAVCSVGGRHRLFGPFRRSLGPQAGTRSRTCSLREQWLHGAVWGPEGHNRSVELHWSSVSILSVLQCFTEPHCYHRAMVPFPFTALFLNKSFSFWTFY